MTDLLNINPEDILTWETKKLWNTLNAIKNDKENNIDKEKYYKIKYGINIECPIWYITEEWYELYPSSKKTKIKGYGKYNLSDFMQEKENRDELMRQEIINNLNDEGIMEGRL